MPSIVRLDRIEQQIEDLRKKQEASEEKISRLEEDLTESQRRVRELEDSISNTPSPQSSRVDGNLRQKVLDIERKCNDISKKCDQLSKLQTILNGLILKGPDKELKQLQAQVDRAQEVLQDDLPSLFESSQKRIKEHRIPLNLSDYAKLSALEIIAGHTNGPATQIGEVVFMNFQSNREEVVRKLNEDGITAAQAKIDYSSLACTPHLFPSGTNFYFLLNWFNNSWKQTLFGINRKNLYVLDINTKKVITEWKMEDVSGCTMDTSNLKDKHIRVEFGASSFLKLRSNEMGDYFELIKKLC